MNFLASLLKQKCPKCRQGNLFVFPTYKISKLVKMHKNCPSCGLLYEKEPSFFYGALYISYALQVAIFTTVIVATKVLYPDAELSWYIASIISASLLLSPFILRLSRSIWIHMFVSYDSKYLKGE